MTILLTTSSKEKRLRLGCKKKLVALKCPKRNLVGAILKFVSFQVSWITCSQQRLPQCLE